MSPAQSFAFATTAIPFFPVTEKTVCDLKVFVSLCSCRPGDPSFGTLILVVHVAAGGHCFQIFLPQNLHRFPTAWLDGRNPFVFDFSSKHSVNLIDPSLHGLAAQVKSFLSTVHSPPHSFGVLEGGGVNPLS